MSEFIRLFPLNIIAFPGELVNLHIFEPRYIQMINECIAQDETFGIVPHLDSVKDTGTEMRVVKVEKTHANGSMDIVTQGKRSFKVREYFPVHSKKLYPAGVVKFIIDNPSEDQTVRTKVLDIYGQLMDILSPGKLPQKENSLLSFKIGHHIALNKLQEYELLCLPTESERQIYILQHLNMLLPVLLEVENLKDRIKKNGYFQPLSSPE